MPEEERDVSHWTDDAIRKVVYDRFSLRPCTFQLKVARETYAGKNVIACAPTGAGKTLSFWIPMLMAKADKLKHQKVILVSPLNLLAKQGADYLKKKGFRAYVLTAETFSRKLLRIIEKGKFDVIVTNPEMLVGRKAVRELFQKPCVSSTLLQFILDEGHTVDQWADFRQQYKHIGEIRYTIPGDIPLYLASATLPPDILHKVKEVLNLNDDNTTSILYSNDRPDLNYVVRPLAAPANSYEDLNFLFPDGFDENSPPPPVFLIFFDNTAETVAPGEYLKSRLPTKELKKRVKWFNSAMTRQFREETLEELRNGELFGLCCTDAFGMGMDVPNIGLVVQYKATVSLPGLLQCFGRAARAPGACADVILLVEKKDTAEGRPKDPSTQPASMPTTAPTQLSTNSTSTTSNAKASSSQVATRKPFSKPKIITIGDALDHFINIPKEFSCRRKLLNIASGNSDRLTGDNPSVCNPELSGGCERCRAKPVGACCDLCNPDYFKKYFIKYVKPKVVRRSALKALPPDVKLSKGYRTLQDNLYTWREMNAPKKLTPYIIAFFGTQYLLPEDTIDCIIHCAYHRKILSVEQLVKETQWRKDWA
ncbi:ATP-dependent DNA helicase Q-like 4B [Leucoagaricus sp. SymC.cos]|nr:ATP-dependent DNA helicase Q-like 4B [Leucoagaricus sp. SymC.cos]